MKKETTRKQTAEKREKGRPSRYSAALAERICDHIRCGCSLRRAADKEGVSHSTVMTWALNNAVFSDQYARACEVRLSALEDKLLDLVEDGHQVAGRGLIGGNLLNAVKLEVETIKWMLAKLMPKKYGDRKAVELTGPNGGPVAVEGNKEKINVYLNLINQIRAQREEEDNGGEVQ